MPVTYDYPRPAVTVDCVVICFESVLLIARKNVPFKGCWALPGGFAEMDETLETAALRELKEETSLTGTIINQVGAFGDPGRDPRGRVISVAFNISVLDPDMLKAGDDAADCMWFGLDELPPLAFDHLEIIEAAVKKRSL